PIAALVADLQSSERVLPQDREAAAVAMPADTDDLGFVHDFLRRIMVELQDAHRVAMETVEEIAPLPERQRNSLHQRRRKIFHFDKIVPNRRPNTTQRAWPLVWTMHGKGVGRTLVHDHEPFLQVLALLAFVARVLERQVSPKLRRVLDRDALLLARRQGEEQLRLLHKAAERR